MVFKEVKFKDTKIQIIDGDRGKNYPKKNEMFNSGHTLFLNNKNIIDDYLDVSHGEYISEEKCDSLRKGKLNRHDIVMSTRGSVGNIGYFSESVPVEHIRINSGMVIFRNEDENIDTEFLFHLLKSDLMKKRYSEMISGSVQNQLPIRDIENIKLTLPLLKVQKQIAKVVRIIEEKIFLNTNLIKSCEELSYTIFKRWFIDFEFPNKQSLPYRSSDGEIVKSELGEIPESWNIKSLSYIAEIIMGQSPKGASYNFNFEGLPLVNGASDFKGGEINPIKYTTEPKKISKKGDYIFGVRATLGNVTETHQEYAIGRGAGIARSKERHLKEFLYFQLANAFNTFEHTASGSVYLNISKNDLNDFKIVLPSKDIIQKFHQIASPMLEKKELLIQENIRLRSIRDALLPKLLSGEIEIPDESVVESS